jgi:hypothetical protein
MKHKGKKINKHRLRQLQITKGRNELASMKLSDIMYLHPNFYRYLKEEGYVSEKDELVKPFGELLGR